MLLLFTEHLRNATVSSPGVGATVVLPSGAGAAAEGCHLVLLLPGRRTVQGQQRAAKAGNIHTHIFLFLKNLYFFLSPGLRSLQGLCRPDPPDQDQPGRPGVVQEPGLHHTGLHAVPLGQRGEKVSCEANNFPNIQIKVLSYLPNTKQIFGPLRRDRDCERRPLPPQGERGPAPAGRHAMAHDQHLPAPKGKSFP